MLKNKWLRFTVVILAVLVIIYFLGPHPAAPAYTKAMPAVPADTAALRQYVQQGESLHKLKPNNEARIVWYNDSLKNKTDYAIVYLHGFSASQEEGTPVHTNIAKEFGCNLYLSRLAEHGIDTIDPMINLTGDKYWESSKQALAIGKQLGKKVILMGTSTGGTNALQLAATYPNDVAAVILLSPNIAIFDKNAWLLNKPWGLQIARLVVGGKYIEAKDTAPLRKQYWYTKYPVEAAVELQEMTATSMTKETFEKVHQPLLLLYYYKDDIHHDSTVSVPAMLDMFNQLGTPTNEKVKEAMPNAGSHVLGSYITSKDLLGVQTAIEKFMHSKLGLQKNDKSSITGTNN